MSPCLAGQAPHPALPLHLPDRPRESACGVSFQVKSSGKRHVPPPRQNITGFPAPPPAGAAPGAASAGRVLARRWREPPSKFGGMEIRVKIGRITLLPQSPFPPRLPLQRTRLSKGTGARQGVWDGTRGRQSRPLFGSRAFPGARRPHVRSRAKAARAIQRRGGRAPSGPVGTDLRALDLAELSPVPPPVRGVGLGQTGGEGARGRGSSGVIAAAAGARAAAVPSGSSPPRRSGRRDADKRGRQHLGPPRRVISTGCERSAL